MSGTIDQSFFKDGTAKVITAVTGDPDGGHTSVYAKEEAIWMGTRDVDHPYGLAASPSMPAASPVTPRGCM
ncbi:hypothetical protein [Streptomyces sp. NPDC002547]